MKHPWRWQRASPRGDRLLRSRALHQFAIALLCLARDCPPAWTCPCNALRRRYNRPPADGAASTDALARGVELPRFRGSSEELVKKE